MSSQEPVVYAVSDGTGETAEQACRAALAQFSPELMSKIKVISHVLDEAAVEAAVKTAKDRRGILAYTLVKPATRAKMREVAARERVVAVDLLSTLISALAGSLKQSPLQLPGLGHQLDAEYFRRVEAVEFAVQNDDGRLPKNLRNAEIVIVGLSRTSKTPLSNYIAHRGYRVANVPLVLEAPLPLELSEVDPQRVFGLVIDPNTLVNIRRSRMESLHMAPGSAYGELDQVRREMLFARRIFAQHPEWTVIDTTLRAIEESAAEILETYRARFEHHADEAPPPAPEKPIKATPTRLPARPSARPSGAASPAAARPRAKAAAPAKGAAGARRKGRKSRKGAKSRSRNSR